VDVAAQMSPEPATRRVDGVAPTVRNSHQTNPRLPSPGRADHARRDRHPAKECVGSNRLEKNDRNFPLQRQSRRITPRRTALTHFPFHQKCEKRTALPMRNSLDRNHSHLTNSFRNGPPDRGRSHRRAEGSHLGPPFLFLDGSHGASPERLAHSELREAMGAPSCGTKWLTATLLTYLAQEQVDGKT